jgi:CBS domain-containing protein
MTLLDKAKETAERARQQATQSIEAGKARIGEVQAGRQYGQLLEKLGEATYAEYRGEGPREQVTRAFTDLDAFTASHPEVTSGERHSTRRAREIMHAGVVCIGEAESLLDAAERMRELGVGSLPICGEDDRLHGIITDRDIVVHCVAEGRDPSKTPCSDLAQGKVYWVDADAGIDEVTSTMEGHQVKRIPVIEDHRLVGVISEADLAQHLSEHQLAEFVERVYAAS